MFNQVFSFYPQNMYYVPQYFTPQIQFSSYFTQLPPTYQNDLNQSNQQYISYPLNWNPNETGSIPNLQENKSDDSESTLEKSEEKRTYKKFSIFKYPKKNAESNIINQIFSFLSLRGKSQPILQKILQGNPQKIQNFYQVLKQLKKRNKKYINRCYIKDLAVFQSSHIGHKIIHQIRKKGSNNSLTAEQFKRAIRTLVSFYLKTKCISTVVTSRKLDKETMKEHLHRKREVHEYFAVQMQILRDNDKY